MSSIFSCESSISIPITFNKPLKVCFSNKKNTITPNTNCKSIFVIKKPGLTDIKDYWYTNLITYHFLFIFSL